MSESTVQNGTVPETVVLDAKAAKNYQAYLEKVARDEKRAADAKAARIRANNRGVDAQGRELPANLAFVSTLADLFDAYGVTYQKDSGKFMERVMAEVLPIVRAMASTPREVAGTTYDVKRKDLLPKFPPVGAVAPAPKK